MLTVIVETLSWSRGGVYECLGNPVSRAALCVLLQLRIFVAPVPARSAPGCSGWSGPLSGASVDGVYGFRITSCLGNRCAAGAMLFAYRFRPIRRSA